MKSPGLDVTSSPDPASVSLSVNTMRFHWFLTARKAVKVVDVWRFCGETCRSERQGLMLQLGSSALHAQG